MQPITLAGVDLAWQSNKNPSAIAVGVLAQGRLQVRSVAPALTGLHQIQNYLAAQPDVQGIAVDAPLIIPNANGQRPCEHALGRDYSGRKAGCHPANLSLYPDALSVQLSQSLWRQGFRHLRGSKWQFECYPHPSLIECFGLPERLLYKKGDVAAKKAGQIQLANLLRQLEHSPRLPFVIGPEWAELLDAERIQGLRGKALKSNEDALDALVCLYIAALYALGSSGRLYGDTEQGYIWVPTGLCC